MNLASFIDHTNLSPDASEEDIRQLCDEAIKWGFASVCVRPEWVEFVHDYLEEKDSELLLCTVIDFPRAKGDFAGGAESSAKAKETYQVIAEGAQEIDMVFDYQALIEGNEAKALADIKAVVGAAQDSDLPVLVKLIIETDRLKEQSNGVDLIRRATELACEGGVDFVKTSTGFYGEGAKMEDVELMASIAKAHGVKVKASGGIRDLKTALAMIEAGAERLGMSGGVAILEQLKLARLHG